MHFVHRSYQPGDTIAALATPAGEGAIAVIRISGAKAFDVAEEIFLGPVKSYKTHTAHYGKITGKTGVVIDSVLLLVMKGPHSYTGEDTVEISCHGGSLIVRQILERIFEAGARPAQPGEFSLQAFLNGKVDLAQAEAVQQLIASKSEIALENAEKQLSGDLSRKIGSFQKELTDVAAILEAWVDFPEEGLEFARFDDLIERLRAIKTKMEKLSETFHEGKMLHEGLSLCLLGTPNVGKSSLMNALLGKERAIVTEIAGTTRDLLEEDLRLSGLHFRLIDTAGVRKTAEIVEQEGVRRTKRAMLEADLILLLLDASRPLQKEDLELLETAPKEKTIVVWNKIDLARPSECIEGISISARERLGLDALRNAIDRYIWRSGPPSKDEVAITKLRHKQALEQAIASLQMVIEGLSSRISAEFVASDMRNALNELGTIIGTNVTEDILSSIFSQFLPWEITRNISQSNSFRESMTLDNFDSEEAKKFLLEREEKEKQEKESLRKKLLQKVISILEEEFTGTSVEVYLIGSILRPFSFTSKSDIDIVLKNYKDDRFDFWTKMESKIGRGVEVIPFETCPFQEFILKDGLKVL